MDSHNFYVGQKVFFRPPYQKDMVESEIVSIKNFVNCDGNVLVFFELANGARVEAERCYINANMMLHGKSLSCKVKKDDKLNITHLKASSGD